MQKLVSYFIEKPVIANVLMFGLLAIAFMTWKNIGKEEMPEFAFNSIRISFRYPGAAAEDVELFIVKPIEERLKGVTELEKVTSTSAFGSGTFYVEFNPKVSNLSEKIQEVKDAIDAVQLPREVDEPIYRQFKSSEKAIIDIGFYLNDVKIHTVETRQKLQSLVLAFKDKLISLPEISGVDLNGYLIPELQIMIDPVKLSQYEITLSQVQNQVLAQNIRDPIGSMKDRAESEVAIDSELNTPEKLEEVIVSAGFSGQKLKLSQVANIAYGFERNNTIRKVQGREGIILNVKKSSNVDILTAQKAVKKFVSQFQEDNGDSGIRSILIDDESYDIRNRLYLIGSNGLIGFILIVIILFAFLDFKSGVWVAMGIPFSLGFTLLGAQLIGFTINNMTLASIIIVLGIVVDDAIIVAENISRKIRNKEKSGVGSTLEVSAPVIVSVLTTCAAFIPLYFFSGRFGLFVKYIPTVIFLMLSASLIESFLVLPSHIVHPFPLIGRFISEENAFSRLRDKMILKAEQVFKTILEFTLRIRFVVIIAFIALLSTSAYIFKNEMKYVMFPREESRDFKLKVIAKDNLNRYEMARKIEEIENVFLDDPQGIVLSVESRIGQNRRGGEVKENEASIMVEITPPSERKKSLNQLLNEWEEKVHVFDGYEEVKVLRSRFGSDSGSPIAIEIQENNDNIRKQVVKRLIEELGQLESITNVEEEKPVSKNQFSLNIKKNKASELGVDYNAISSTLRTYIEGNILYTLNSGEEEVDVRMTSDDKYKKEIDEILKLTVANDENYLLPIKDLVEVQTGTKPANISRTNFKRAITVYADINKQTQITPLEIANIVEADILTKVLKGFPSTIVNFRGEIEDSRESQEDFSMSITLVLALIYILLVIMFESFWTPLLVAAIIPFGVVGSTFAFWTHGYTQYGFFAIIGTLGMIGVVINDSIVLINSLENANISAEGKLEKIAYGTSQRLRAIFITTITTVAGLFPTAYGLGGYDSMLAEMMLAMGWGLLFGMFITLLLTPCLYSFYVDIKNLLTRNQV